MPKDIFQLTQTLDGPSRERMSANHTHWEQRAAQHKSSHSASWEDFFAVRLEIETVSKYIKPGTTVLDVGCANGFTTFEMLSKKPRLMRAFDYSPSMVAEAKAAQPARDPEGVITFYPANALEIPEEDNKFDVAYAVRVIINLPTWQAQQEAIRQIHRVLKPNGLYVMSEAFAGSQENLNRLRREAGLKPLAAPSFNLYMEERLLEDFVKPLFEIVAIEKFSSLYYVASRFVRELAMRPGEPHTYNHPVNVFFSDMPSTECSGDFGIQKAYILRKL